MKCFVFLCLVFTAGIASAIMVGGFEDTDTYIRRGKDIVIAKCVAIPENKPILVNGHWTRMELMDGLYEAEVDVIRTLKGSKQPGKLSIAVLDSMSVGRTYLLYSMGGHVDPHGDQPAVDFMGHAGLSVVEIPPRFDLTKLDDKTLREQILLIFAERLAFLTTPPPAEGADGQSKQRHGGSFNSEHEKQYLEMATSEAQTAELCKAYLRAKYRCSLDNTPRTIVTKDKQTYTGAVITGTDSKSATITYDEGVVSIRRGRLPDDIRMKLDMPVLVEKFINEIELAGVNIEGRGISRRTTCFRKPEDTQEILLKKVDDEFQRRILH